MKVLSLRFTKMVDIDATAYHSLVVDRLPNISGVQLFINEMEIKDIFVILERADSLREFLFTSEFDRVVFVLAFSHEFQVI